MAKQVGDGDSFQLDNEAIRELEETIFSARNFVVPSPDLRPRTLEQARDAHRIHVWANRIAVAAFGCMFLWSIAIIATRHLGQYRDKLTGPFPDELEQRAARYPSHDRYGTQWRLVEAFQQERSLQTEDSSVRTMRGPQPGSAKDTF
jgi:hypothetical protein